MTQVVCCFFLSEKLIFWWKWAFLKFEGRRRPRVKNWQKFKTFDQEEGNGEIPNFALWVLGIVFSRFLTCFPSWQNKLSGLRRDRHTHTLMPKRGPKSLPLQIMGGGAKSLGTMRLTTLGFWGNSEATAREILSNFCKFTCKIPSSSRDLNFG